VTEEEIEAVAHELAKAGGSSWYPGRSSGPILRAVHKRYRDRAQVAIAALDRFRAARDATVLPDSAAPKQEHVSENSALEDQFQVGTIVVYRPPGDQRALSCRIEKIEDGRAYLVPVPHRPIGWVSLGSLEPLEP
jgi:hypothetical protein